MHQQTGWNKVSSPLRADVENPHLVPQRQGNTQSKALTGLTQCYRGRPLQEESDPVDRFSRKFTKFGRVPRWISLQLA